MILVGFSALCWAIWRRRIDIVFNKTKYTSFMQALFRGTYWLRFWSQLQPEDDTKEKASLMLEVIALEHANHGWKHNNRLRPFDLFDVLCSLLCSTMQAENLLNL
jgi:hypothetical protein